jgi:hypothetical protein
MSKVVDQHLALNVLLHDEAAAEGDDGVMEEFTLPVTIETPEYVSCSFSHQGVTIELRVPKQ